MNITYLKPHNGKNAGETGEVKDGIGKYLKRTGVAVADEDVDNVKALAIVVNEADKKVLVEDMKESLPDNVEDKIIEKAEITTDTKEKKETKPVSKKNIDKP